MNGGQIYPPPQGKLPSKSLALLGLGKLLLGRLYMLVLLLKKA